MNERIEKIMYDTDMIDIPADDEFTDTDFLADMDPRRVQKFAEMLIKECVKVCSDQRDPANLNYKPSEKFADAIKMHFGVK